MGNRVAGREGADETTSYTVYSDFRFDFHRRTLI
jgi:hypothetical protein